MYTKQQVQEATKEYFKGDELAANVFFKYALRDKQDNFHELTPDDMHRRLAKEFARVESRYANPMKEEEIYELFKDFKWVVPQGSPMYGIGNNFALSSLSNCVVVANPEDTVTSIVDSGKDLANLFKRRCGVGIDISDLRPDNTPVNNSAGTTTGAWSFADFYSYVCRMIGQNGRRGALMISMDVRHPDVEKFAVMKHDLTKVTGANVSIRITDDFMKAVEGDQDFTLHFPVGSPDPKFTKVVRAKDLWKLIVDSATKTAEPGLLMWDNIVKNLPAHSYPQFKTLTTNPCFSGDTLIATADGRNAVSIRQLAEEGKDVPVYSVDPETGDISIKNGRNPRITGYNQKLLRVWLDDNTYYDFTPNHQLLTREGLSIEAKDLTVGTSLMPFNKRITTIKEQGKKYYRVYKNAKAHTKEVLEHRLTAKFFNSSKWDKLYSEESKNGWIKGGLVVHHKDFNGLNNSPENLEIMTFKEHAEYHASIDTKGEKNGHFMGKMPEEIYQAAMQLTQKLNRRFSTKEWQSFAKENAMPMTFSSMYHETLGRTPRELAILCANELGVENTNVDPRLQKTLIEMIKQGYKAEIIDNSVFVEKTCEICSSEFCVQHNRREQSFCSQLCVTAYLNKKENSSARIHGINKHLENRSEKLKQEQARIYSNLKFKLNRIPLKKEWEEECRQQNVSFRTGKNLKTSFKSWEEVKDHGNHYNHKVTKIEQLEGLHTVYNITVDDNHTVALTTVHATNSGNQFNGIFVMQCGEIPLSAYDSCRLISINLKHFVKNPFTKEAFFDLTHFEQVARKAMRLSDDLIDLEIEKLTAIINLCDTQNEKELWTKLLKACVDGRRTGLGTHGLADAIACCGIRYDSEEGIELIDQIYKTLRDSAYAMSVKMAKERGAFPLFDWELEKENEFIKRLPEQIKKEMAKVGRRNIALLTNAPTGSVSIESQTSSGIEPVFKNFYVRRRKLDQSEVNTKPDFVDQLGDRWINFKVYHHNVQEYLQMMKTDVVPDFFVESDNINWQNRVRIQATIQNYIDHSISSTINLPKGTTPEVVGELYLNGWKLGLKGITVYVDGSRDGVLITETKKEDDFKQYSAPKRKQALKCDIHHLTVKGEKWLVLVGLYDGKPYEVFGGLANKIVIPSSIKEGEIIKKKSGEYQLKFGEDGFVSNIKEAFQNTQYADLTRLISLSLRHGAHVKFLVEQIQKSETESMTTFSKAVARVLKEYIKEGEEVTGSGSICPSCQGKLVYRDGCASCEACGWSKCN